MYTHTHTPTLLTNLYNHQCFPKTCVFSWDTSRRSEANFQSGRCRSNTTKPFSGSLFYICLSVLIQPLVWLDFLISDCCPTQALYKIMVSFSSFVLSSFSRHRRSLWPVPTQFQSQPQSSGLLPAAAAHSRQHGGADPLLTSAASAPRSSHARWSGRKSTAAAPWPAPPGPGVYAHQPTAGQPAASDGSDSQPAVRSQPAAGAAVAVAAVS